MVRAINTATGHTAYADASGTITGEVRDPERGRPFTPGRVTLAEHLLWTPRTILQLHTSVCGSHSGDEAKAELVRAYPRCDVCLAELLGEKPAPSLREQIRQGADRRRREGLASSGLQARAPSALSSPPGQLQLTRSNGIHKTCCSLLSPSWVFTKAIPRVRRSATGSHGRRRLAGSWPGLTDLPCSSMGAPNGCAGASDHRPEESPNVGLISYGRLRGPLQALEPPQTGPGLPLIALSIDDLHAVGDECGPRLGASGSSTLRKVSDSLRPRLLRSGSRDRAGI